MMGARRDCSEGLLGRIARWVQGLGGFSMLNPMGLICREYAGLKCWLLLNRRAGPAQAKQWHSHGMAWRAVCVAIRDPRPVYGARRVTLTDVPTSYCRLRFLIFRARQRHEPQLVLQRAKCVRYTAGPRTV